MQNFKKHRQDSLILSAVWNILNSEIKEALSFELSKSTYSLCVA